MITVMVAEVNAKGLSNAYKRKAFCRKQMVVTYWDDVLKEGKELFRSSHYDGRQDGPRSNRSRADWQARAIATKARQKIDFGLHPTTPDEILRDYLLSNGLLPLEARSETV